MLRSAVLLHAVLLFWIGCAEPEAAAPGSGQAGDAGVAGGGAGGEAGGGGAGGVVEPPLTVLAPVPPAPVAPPSMAPCDGFAAVAGPEGAQLCAPPAPPATPCTGARVYGPWGEGCSPIGRGCADARPPEGAQVRQVRAGAAGGDGSAASPFGTFGAALRGATAGTIVWAWPGRYRETFTIPRDVIVEGACASGVIVEAPSESRWDATIELSSGAALRQVTVTGPRRGVMALAAGEASVEAVVVDTARVVGLAVENGHLTARDVLVRDISAPGGLGTGFYVGPGGRLDGERLAVEAAQDMGIAVAGDANATIHGFAARDLLQGDGTTGGAIWLDVGGAAELDDVLVERCLAAVVAWDGGSATVRRVWARDLDVTAFAARAGSMITVEGAWLEHVGPHGANADGAGTTVTVRDALFSDVRAPPALRTLAVGALASDGGTVRLERVVFDRVGDIGLSAADPTGVLIGEDVVVREVRGTADSARLTGYGVAAIFGGIVDLTRARLSEISGYGAGANGRGTVIALRDTEVGDVRRPSDSDGVAGAIAMDGARLQLRRVLVHDVDAAGVGGMHGGAAIEAEDLELRAIRSVRQSAYGLFANGAVTMSGLRVRVEGVEGYAVVAFERSTIELHEAAVLHTTAAPCDEPDCAEPRYGVGVSALGGTIRLQNFAVRDAALAGVQITPGGALDLSRGEIASCRIGANVFAEDYDLGRLDDEVTFRDNGRDLDSAELALPDAADLPVPPPAGG